MAFERLAQAVAPARVEAYNKARGALDAAETSYSELYKGYQDNPFFTFAPEQVEDWQAKVALYTETKRSISETNSQKGQIVLAYSESLKKNTDLKVKDSFYAKVLNDVTEEFLAKQEESLSKAYKYIYGQEKWVTLKMEEFRGKKYIRLKLIAVHGEDKYSEGVDDEGFFAQTALGTILLIYFIVTYGLPRVVFFDETLSGGEDGNLGRFMDLLREFVEKMGFTFIVVTHDRHRLEKYADRLYKVSNGVYQLVEKTDGVE